MTISSALRGLSRGWCSAPDPMKKLYGVKLKIYAQSTEQIIAPSIETMNTLNRLTRLMRKQATVMAARNTGRTNAPNPKSLEIRKSAQMTPILPPLLAAETEVEAIESENLRLWSEYHVKRYETRAAMV